MTSRFRTAPADEDSRFSFAVVGNSGDGGRVQLEVAGLLGRLRPDLILHTGTWSTPAEPRWTTTSVSSRRTEPSSRRCPYSQY